MGSHNDYGNELYPQKISDKLKCYTIMRNVNNIFSFHLIKFAESKWQLQIKVVGAKPNIIGNISYERGIKFIDKFS